MGATMSDQRWTTTVPTEEGWYWVKWKKGERTREQIAMFYFDASEYDVHQLTTRAELYYGPLQPPEL